MCVQRQIYAYATTHHGLITKPVAERLGIASRTWYRMLKRAQLDEVHRGVARMPGSPMTAHQSALAAVWACGTGALASHRTSASLWGAERPNRDPIDVITLRNLRRSPSGVVVHRPTSTADLFPQLRFGIPVTSPLRMLVDLGSVDPEGVYPAMEAIIIRGLASPIAVVATLERHAIKGRHGTAALRDALARYPFARAIADSVLETKMAALANRYRLPPMTFHEIVEGWEVDFRIDGTNILLECDGRKHHEYDVEQFERDRQRDQDHAAAGYIVVRFTWTQLTAQPASVARRITQIVERWAPEIAASRRRS